MKANRIFTASLTAGVLALGLAACGGGDQPTSTASPTTTVLTAEPAPKTSVSATTTATQGLDESKPHEHAPLSGEGLTAGEGDKGGKLYVLGELRNEGHETITITSASSEYAGTVELHKTEGGVMSVATEGWTIKPGESLTLREDGYHLSVKDLKATMTKGDAFKVTLQTSEGPAHLELVIGDKGASHSH